MGNRVSSNLFRRLKGFCNFLRKAVQSTIPKLFIDY